MDLAPSNQTALVPAGAPGLPVTAGASPALLSSLSALPPRRLMALAAGVAALVALLVVATLWTREGDYRVLYANLSDKDGGAIIAQLSQMNVPYRHAEGGSAILVPAARVHDLRLRLASQGLPRGSVTGFELMDTSRFGMTQFQERLTFQRGLEGELTRSIQALSAVSEARVHLALPNQNGFFREQQKPSASVLLTLHPGRTLERAQVAGIVHLVSSSVPELAPSAVSVLDQSGALLSGQKDGGDTNGLDTQQRQFVTQLEATFARRVLDILEPIVGRENVRAQVSAEVDFSLVESTSEQFRPNQGGEVAAVRSQQTLESTGSSGLVPAGVPGAVSNQPAPASQALVTAPAQGAQNAQASASGNSRRESVVNYEVDKTIRVMRTAPGSVKRVTAAVAINHRTVTAPNGRVSTVALTDEELAKLESLVRETIGYTQERGDSVRVINVPFQQPQVVEPTPVPLWQQPELVSLVRSVAAPLGLAILGLIVVLGVIRPALKAASQPTAVRGRQLDAVVSDVEMLPGSGGAAPGQAPPSLPMAVPARLDDLRTLARDNPAAVANVVRGWVHKEAAA